MSCRRARFEQFYELSKDRCFRAVLATVGDASEADDVLAEAFTRAWSRWNDLDDHPAPAAWVVRTAVNLHRDRWRRSRRWLGVRRRTPSDDAYVETIDPALARAIRELPERQREAIVYRVLLGLSGADAAAEMGVDPGTVGTHLRRALAALRSAIPPPSHVTFTTEVVL